MKRNLKTLRDKGKADRINVTAGTRLWGLQLTWEFPLRPPLSLYRLSPEPTVYPQTHRHLWSCLACWIFFISIARGSQPGNQNMENGTGKRRLGGGGGLIYIRDHTDAAPRAKLKLKRNSPKKNQSRGLAEEKKRHSPLVLANMGHRLHKCVRICASACRNVKIKHKHTPSSLKCGWDVGPRGQIRPPAGTGSSLMKLALVFNQLSRLRRFPLCSNVSRILR